MFSHRCLQTGNHPHNFMDIDLLQLSISYSPPPEMIPTQPSNFPCLQGSPAELIILSNKPSRFNFPESYLGKAKRKSSAVRVSVMAGKIGATVEKDVSDRHWMPINECCDIFLFPMIQFNSWTKWKKCQIGDDDNLDNEVFP